MFASGNSGWPCWLALAVFCGLVAGPRRLAADQLDAIRQRGTLIWGGDAEGGGPYVFPDAKDPHKVVGFEVELAEMLAQELGVKAEFQQGQWENVPALVDRGTVDIALNGYELTPARARLLLHPALLRIRMQLLVRRDSWIHSWSDLELPAAGALFTRR